MTDGSDFEKKIGNVFFFAAERRRKGGKAVVSKFPGLMRNYRNFIAIGRPAKESEKVDGEVPNRHGEFPGSVRVRRQKNKFHSRRVV